MGLFDEDENLPDPEEMTIKDAINELMSRAREGQFIQRWYVLANGAYGKIMAMEPECRTADQDVFVRFMEKLTHQVVCSLGWCDKLDDPFHVEEHKTSMRVAALEMEKEWTELCATGDPSYAEVNQYIDNVIKGI